MQKLNPNLAWYPAVGEGKGLLPRCSFASVRRCPRYYETLSLLGDAGSTKIDPEEDKRLLQEWQQSDLWPRTAEQSASIMGPTGNPRHFRNFCPEIGFEAFGLFASDLSRYVDETDMDAAHRQLAKEGADPSDWRWSW